MSSASSTEDRWDWDAQGAGHTIREIRQQPFMWQRATRLVAERRAEIDAFLADFAGFANSADLPGRRIVLTGAGSSAFAGEVLAPTLARRLHRRVDAVATTDIVSNPREVFAEDVPTLLVSLARSGDSPESTATTQLADQSLRAVRHLVVTCNANGRLAQDHAKAPSSLVLAMPDETNDRGFAMTSSFTTMLLATWLALDPTASDAIDVGLLARAADDVLAGRIDDVADLAGRNYQRVVYLGSGPLAALARESALKMLELTAGRVVSYFDTSLGFRHGPKSVLGPGSLAAVYLSNDRYTRRYDEDIVDELCDAVGVENVLVLTAQPEQLHGDQVWWRLPELAAQPDAALALPFLLVGQLLALHMSLALGITPDNPFPAGEVNRVVEGVTVYPLDSR
ncbi:MAG TPA: SIS domain-containing protein [Jatrophihabitantaceae bacterium]|jgi:tagatose-6-phosphate ketose/aldose isomerase